MATNSNKKRTLIENLDQLSPKRLAEVEEFVDFLTSKVRRRTACQSIMEGVLSEADR